jgi:cytochrome bd-type quinol oxidase subunit 1
MELIVQIAAGVLIGMILFAFAQAAFWAVVRWALENPVWALVIGIILVLLGCVAVVELFHPDQLGVLR